jgi:hypothetical protein
LTNCHWKSASNVNIWYKHGLLQLQAGGRIRIDMRRKSRSTIALALIATVVLAALVLPALRTPPKRHGTRIHSVNSMYRAVSPFPVVITNAPTGKLQPQGTD